MIRTATLLGVAAALVLGACRVDEQPPPAIRDTAPVADSAVLAELRRYYADFSARDWERFADHFWPGATLTTVWQPPGEPAPRVVTTTVPEFVRQAPQGPGSQPIFEERMTSAETRVSGDLAQAWATYEVRFGSPDSVATWRGMDAFTLVRHDGRWRIASLAWADLPDDAPAP